jgi:hypothetical protein
MEAIQNKRIICHGRLLIVTLLVCQAVYFTINFQLKSRVLLLVDTLNNSANKNGTEDINSFGPTITELFHNDNDIMSSSYVCRVIDAGTEPSFQRVWEMKKKSIMNVSLVSAKWANDIRSNQNFTNWVTESMSYFTYSRLQHSMISTPIDQTRSIGRIRTILEQRLAHPNTAPPLRIVIFGGSVTTGHSCLDNLFDFPIRKDGGSNHGNSVPRMKECAWSGRLQDMMDEIFGNDVIEIKNMAISGGQTDMSTAVLEFGVIPGATPDIIIWDHGINDATTRMNTDVPYHQAAKIDAENVFEKLQKFYQATTTLPISCDQSDPPIVILLDSLLGEQNGKLPRVLDSLKISTAVSKMITWYPDIWGISYANIVRPYILSKVSKEHNMLRLLGSYGLITHPGMMYHISIAWTVMFNFLYALHENCITQDIIQTPQSSTKHIVDVYHSDQRNDYLKLSNLPELNDELQVLDVPKLWSERIPKPIENKECLEKQRTTLEASKKFTKHSSLKCFYVWMVNRVLNVESIKEVQSVVEPYIVKNNGWMANGTAPRVGWLPVGGRGSFFELQFDDVPLTINSLTIIYMKSYSEKWFNSTLQIDCRFANPLDIEGKTIVSTPRSMETNETNVDYNTIKSPMVQHKLSGYHEDETSILVPVKLSIPNRTLEDGKSMLRIQFTLIEGETFKIAGIALC